MNRLGGALFGLEDVTTGDADLDARVVVKGVPIHIVQGIVGNVRFQQELMRLFEHNGTIYVDQHGAHFRYPSRHDATDEQKTRVILNALTRTAAALQEAAS